MPKLGWSDFARGRHVRGGAHVWFEGTHEELLDLVREHWHARRPGVGRAGLDEVVVVPVPPDRFVPTTVLVGDDTPLVAVLDRRQPHEEPVIRVTAAGEPAPAAYAAVVLYAGGDVDWEVVSLQAGAVADEPMHPITMARNYLQCSGGTFAPYTARQFAEAIWYWSRRAPRTS